MLAHEDYLYRFGRHAYTYAFGCPRVVSWLSGDIWERWAFCHIYNHRRDIVGRVPPVALGFRHAVAVQYFGSGGISSPRFHYPEIYEAIE